MIDGDLSLTKPDRAVDIGVRECPFEVTGFDSQSQQFPRDRGGGDGRLDDRQEPAAECDEQRFDFAFDLDRRQVGHGDAANFGLLDHLGHSSMGSGGCRKNHGGRSHGPVCLCSPLAVAVQKLGGATGHGKSLGGDFFGIACKPLSGRGLAISHRSRERPVGQLVCAPALVLPLATAEQRPATASKSDQKKAEKKPVLSERFDLTCQNDRRRWLNQSEQL